uniref:IlGF domain-containing protein n=1 Tax=Panagrellus redivivus TaxID=6233 RepID=A0A7E4VJ33_PANRE
MAVCNLDFDISNYPDDTEVRLCGSKLIFTIAKICNYHTPRPNSDMIPSRHHFHRRPKRSITNDCCRNRCTIRYIKSFCG